jgi:chlorophyllide a reductase subunit Z
VKPTTTRPALVSQTPLILFGSVNERMYLAETGGRSPTSRLPFGRHHPAHTGTPFMGYSGASYIVQEVCNALFDALFHIIPLGTELDRIQATPARFIPDLAWDEDARAALEELVEAQPVLVRISAAKRLRDNAEHQARLAGRTHVGRDHITGQAHHQKETAA